MALTPGGGRSPSTRPPPAPPPAGQPRQSRDSRQPPASQAASFSVLRWGLLLGGLVIIVDLATQVMLQRSLGPDEVDAIGAADEIINFVLFSILGMLVVRDSGLIYLGAVAGVFASLLDAVVVAAATTMAPPAGQTGPVEEVFLFNLAIGTVFAGLGGVAYTVLRRWSGGRRQ
ncbi:MAG: hypothetical protein ACR2IK_00725 [Chloroflexota bacterium]